jgi:hypothetical protein
VGEVLSNKQDQTHLDDSSLDEPLEPYKFYFRILLLLRTFVEWTRETYEDFQQINNQFITLDGLKLTPAQLQRLRDNSKEVLLHFEDVYTPIKQRLTNKIDEVKSLGDDVSPHPQLIPSLTNYLQSQFLSGISALEATKSTTLGRFAMLFTVMTILYLPPGFTSVSSPLGISKQWSNSQSGCLQHAHIPRQ